MKTQYLTACLLGVALTGLTACSDSSDPATVNQAPNAVISKNGSDLTCGEDIVASQGQSLTFSGVNSNDPEESALTYIWNKDESDGSVDKLITFSNAGISSVSLYVKDAGGSYSSACIISVNVLAATASDDTVLAIAINGESKVTVDKTISLSAVVDYETDPDGTVVVWSVAAGTGTAEISPSGVLRGKTVGTVVVSAKQGGVTKTKNITVEAASADPIATVDGITINGGNEVEENSYLQLTALVKYSDGTEGSDVVWSIAAGTGDAEIDSNGLLTGKVAGTVTVTAKIGGITKTLEVTITEEDLTKVVESVTISGDTVVKANASITLSAVVKYSNANDGSTVTWTVANGTGAAEINAAGELSGKTVGMVTVTAEKGGQSDSLEVEVLPADITGLVVESIVITGSNTVDVDATMSLSALVTYTNDSTGDEVSWSVVDGTGSAEITANGVLTGKTAGTVTVSAEKLGETQTKTVTVELAAPEEINIYIKAPTAWDTSLWYWDLGEDAPTSLGLWPGKAVDAAAVSGWFVEVFTTETLPTGGIIINNGAAKATIKTVNLTPPTASGCFIVSDTASGTDGDGAAAHTATWQDIGTGDCAFGAPILKVAATPSSKSFVGESIEVTLSVDDIAQGSSGFYTIDGSDPASSATRLSYNDGDTITLGDTLELTEFVTLKLFAAHSDSEGEDASETFTYTKTDVQSCTPNIDSGDFKFCAETYDDAYVVSVQYNGSGTLDLANSQILLNGAEVSADDASGNSLTFSASGLAPSKYSYTLRLKTDTGTDIRPLFIPMWIGSGMKYADFGWKDSIMYQIFNDRFLDGDPSNNIDNSQGSLNEITDVRSQWQGGDFAGITQKIKEGYFADMGINTLWISSPILNSHNSQPGVQPGDTIRYGSYHSYHPVATGYTHLNKLGYGDNPIETAFGTPAEFKELINEAHQRGIRIVPDFVANHTHREAQIFVDHSNWFYDQVACAPSNWDGDLRTSCWFTSDMPDINFKGSTEAVNAVVEHALWIIQEFNIDGFRADALKHMDDEFVKALKVAVLEQIETRVNDHVMTDEATIFYMVGESLNGEWPRYHTREDMVHGQVNSSLYHAINNSLLAGSASLSDFANTAINEDTTYLTEQAAESGRGGYRGAVMGNFFGNHDVTRALTRAGGDYGRLRLAQTFLFTSPGNVPMLYQGDDIGTFGGEDPDNRLKMKFAEIDGLSGDEAATLAHVQKVGLLRSAHPALRRGSRSIEQADNDFWAYKVTYENDEVYVAINRGGDRSYNPPAGFSDGLGNCSGGSVPAVSSCIFVKD